MTPLRRRRRNWAGRSITAIGVWHTLFGLYWYARPLRVIADRGYIGSVGWGLTTPALAFWFIAAGALASVLGALATWIERRERLPRFFGWSLVALGVAGGLALPASGFWLLLVPGVGIVVRHAAAARRTVADSARAGRAA